MGCLGTGLFQPIPVFRRIPHPQGRIVLILSPRMRTVGESHRKTPRNEGVNVSRK